VVSFGAEGACRRAWRLVRSWSKVGCTLTLRDIDSEVEEGLSDRERGVSWMLYWWRPVERVFLIVLSLVRSCIASELCECFKDGSGEKWQETSSRASGIASEGTEKIGGAWYSSVNYWIWCFNLWRNYSFLSNLWCWWYWLFEDDEDGSLHSWSIEVEDSVHSRSQLVVSSKGNFEEGSRVLKGRRFKVDGLISGEVYLTWHYTTFYNEVAALSTGIIFVGTTWVGVIDTLELCWSLEHGASASRMERVPRLSGDGTFGAVAWIGVRKHPKLLTLIHSCNDLDLVH
jgi:hypothetical protein